MSLVTSFLNLFKYDKETDGASTFNIDKALNENWDKIDTEMEQLSQGLENHTHNSSEIIQDSSHRFVSDAEKVTWNEKASKYHLTATLLSTGWGVNPNGGYRQTVSCTGITCTMSPIFDVLLGSDIAANKLLLEAFLNVNDIESGAGEITVYCYDEAPTINFTLFAKGAE